MHCREMRLKVLVPLTEAIPEEGCPVLYLLHGYSDNEESFLEHTRWRNTIGV